MMADPEAAVLALRERRAIRVTRRNPDPIRDPIREVVFSSNVLLTLPADPGTLERLNLDDSLKARIRAAGSERQLFFYDHPIHIGEPPESNEVVYGLQGPGRSRRLGKTARRSRRRTKKPPSSCRCPSPTRAPGGRSRGLHPFAVGPVPPLEHLRVYIFSELDCRRLVEGALSCVPGRPRVRLRKSERTSFRAC